MPDPPRTPGAREHDLVGHLNPHCVRCGRTLIDLIVNQRPCKRTPLKAELKLAARQERAGS